MRSVKARLATLLTAIAAVVVLAQAVSLYVWVRRSLEHERVEALTTQGRLLAERFLEEYEESRRGVAVDIPGEVRAFVHVSGVAAEIRGEDGAIVFASEGFRPEPAEDGICATVDGVPYRGRRDRITAGDGRTFGLTVAVSEEPYRRQLARLLIYYAFFCPAVLLAAWLLGYLFVARTLAPVEQMRRQAERISRESLSERVTVPRSTGEFRNLALTFNEMLDRLDRAFQDLQHFAADAAHELRTPLANLRAEIETAIQRERTPEEYERILASVAEETSRMSRIVSDLLTLARLDMRQVVFRREPVALGPLIEDTLETFRPVAETRGIRIRADAGGAVVLGDADALRRVLMNLVENAVKYNREGGEVWVAAAGENGRVRIRVEDTGIGIPPEHLPHLFRRFYRIDTSRAREHGGAGLGLAICRSFVEAHDGRIEVASEAGRGTSFTVELPAAAGSGSRG